MSYVQPYQGRADGDGRALAPGQAGLPAEYRQDPYPNYAQFDQQAEGQSFDIYKYLRIAVKYRWLILGCLVTALVIAAALTSLMTPIYRSTVSIQIDREAMSVVDVKELQPQDDAKGIEFYQTQYELLASRSLAERVIASLGLAEDRIFNSKSTSPLTALKDLIFGPAPEQEMVDASMGAIDRLELARSVAPVRNSRIVRLTIRHANPEMAQRIANGYAEAFIADSLDRRFDATAFARKFLEDRLSQLKAKLEESEKQLVKYAEEQGIISLGENRNLTTTDLEAINVKLTEARSERIKKELVWKQAQQSSGFGLKQILDSKAIQENRTLRSRLAAEYQQKLAIYKPAFPAMIELRNQIKELDRSVQSEIAAIKNSIEAEFLAAQQEEETLEAQLTSTKTDVVDQRNRSIEYNILQREVDTNRQLYDGLLQRYKEIGVAGGVGTNNISIVDRAVIPLFPSSPNLPLNLAIGFLAGLMLGIVLALLLDYMDDTFKSPEDIEREVGISVVGVIPKPKKGVGIEEEMMDARSGIAEAIRSLRTGLQFSTSDGLPKTLLVTSSKPAEGKTTTTIALAKSLAQIGLNVLLIDGDLRNSSVHKRMFCSNEFGLSNFLTGSRAPDDCVQATDTEGLVLMSAGPLPPNPAELLSGPRFASLLAMAQQSFNIVVIDGPPVMGLADSPLLASAVQATVMAIAANETRRSVVKVAAKRLFTARANIVGALLTKFDASQTGYGYGYGYGDYEYHSYGAKELPAPGQ